MKKIGLILLLSVMCFNLTGCQTSEEKETPVDNEKQTSYVEEETVEVLVAKFNTEVVDNTELFPASNDYLTVSDNVYWYGLMSGVYLAVIPVEFTNDASNEIVDYMILQVDKVGEYESNATEYLKCLIKANNEELTEEEIEELITNSKESENIIKGIEVDYVENDDVSEYRVIRLYK